MLFYLDLQRLADVRRFGSFFTQSIKNNSQTRRKKVYRQRYFAMLCKDVSEDNIYIGILFNSAAFIRCEKIYGSYSKQSIKNNSQIRKKRTRHCFLYYKSILVAQYYVKLYRNLLLILLQDNLLSKIVDRKSY